LTTALLDQPRQRVVELAVKRVGEVLALQELADPMVGGVVDQDRAQESLLGLEILRGQAEVRFFDTREQGDVRGFLFGLHGRAFAIWRGTTLARTKIVLQRCPTGNSDNCGDYSAAIDLATAVPRSASIM
jgi:hypothetical protein